MKTMMWEVDGTIEGQSFSDSFSYNDSGNELVNIGDFCNYLWETVNNNMDEFSFETVSWMEIATAAYVSGRIQFKGQGVELSIQKVEEWSGLPL
jgi:hypothetical protein